MTEPCESQTIAHRPGLRLWHSRFRRRQHRLLIAAANGGTYGSERRAAKSRGLPSEKKSASVGNSESHRNAQRDPRIVEGAVRRSVAPTDSALARSRERPSHQSRHRVGLFCSPGLGARASRLTAAARPPPGRRASPPRTANAALSTALVKITGSRCSPRSTRRRKTIVLSPPPLWGRFFYTRGYNGFVPHFLDVRTWRKETSEPWRWGRVLMLWTAPPPAHECHERWVL
jgi:hypothetical protein